MKTTIVRRTWEAWAASARLCWEVIKDIPPQTKTLLELLDIAESNKQYAMALGEWYALQDLADELGIDWVYTRKICKGADAAADEHAYYENLIWKHAIHK